MFARLFSVFLLCYFNIFSSYAKENHVHRIVVKSSNMEELVGYVHHLFGPYNARIVYSSIKDNLNEQWYDPMAKLEIYFINTQNNKLIQFMQFIGSGKCIKIYLKDFQKKTIVSDTKNDLIKLSINSKHSLIDYKFPSYLVKNIEAFMKKINKNYRSYTTMDVIYRSSDFKIQAIILYLGKQRHYFIDFDGNILNYHGYHVFPSVYPQSFGLKGKVFVTSRFGWRIHPVSRRKTLHGGIDLRAPHGTKIYSAYDGKVIFCGWIRGYGKCIKIDHGNKVMTYYAHLSKFSKKLKVGVFVKKGQFIGKSGSTGISTGAHLHFEVRVNHKPVDPLTFKFVFFKRVQSVEFKSLLKKIDNLDSI